MSRSRPRCACLALLLLWPPAASAPSVLEPPEHSAADAARLLGSLLLTPRTSVEVAAAEPTHMPHLQSSAELDAPSAAKAASRRKAARRAAEAAAAAAGGGAGGGASARALPPLSPRGQQLARSSLSVASAATAASLWEGDGACIPGSMQRAVRSYQRGLCPPEQLFQPTSFTLKYRGPRSARGAKRAEALTGVVP